MKRIATGFFLIVTVLQVWAQPAQKPLPIIDMHLHAIPYNDQGPPPTTIGAPYRDWSALDPKQGGGMGYMNQLLKSSTMCENCLTSAPSDDALRNQTLSLMKKYNIIGVTSGPMSYVQRWQKEAPDRIIPGVLFTLGDPQLTLDSMRHYFKTGAVKVFGELCLQYQGIALSDSVVEPYLALAEEYDIPVSIHIGTGPPGVAYFGASAYRARLHSAFTAEEAMIRHPKLRVAIAHAGWPLLDDLLATLYTHPQAYVDLGVICYILPRKEFYAYLKRIMDAGFGKRVMFGSDQMVWPQAIEVGIKAIEEATFLSPAQKRDIFYNNAARFLRLKASSK
ncbi:amidohydrolase family protein [Rudanella lutea]|uniref:amidohydrolase family protein n=1 Tax=Rudanella lutea TaxID=451374 RepID=UPI00037EAF06|nr:amidohydrolase family protein [Rudanella lutea]